MIRLDRRRAAWAVFGLALALRGLYAWRSGLPLPIVGDALEYHDYAKNLVELGRYLGPYGDSATRMPGYPLFLALLRLVFGGWVGAWIAAQCVLGAATCALTYRLALRLLPDPWPGVAGAMAACYFGMIEPSAYLLSECLYSFLLVLSLWALYEQSWTPGRRALAFGGLSGALYLVRPEPLPYILATCAALPALFPGFRRREALLGLAAVALTTGLWVGRNLATFGRFMPASSVGKSVGYLSLFLPAEQFGWTPEGRQSAPVGSTELERDAFYAEKWRELRARLTPVQIVRAYAFNLLSILYPFLPAYDWTYVFALPFAALGLFAASRRRELMPVAGAALCSISVFIFFGGPASRYRQGIAPCLVLLAAAGMAELWRRAGPSRARSLTRAWLAVNAGIWLFSDQARWAALRLKEVITG